MSESMNYNINTYSKYGRNGMVKFDQWKATMELNLISKHIADT